MISKHDIRHLSDLVRVEVSDKEAEKLADDLQAILAYVDKLKELRIEKSLEIAHLPYIGGMPRSDKEPKEDEMYQDVEALIDAAPQKENGYVKVGAVFAK